MNRQGNGLLVAAVAVIALALWIPDTNPSRAGVDPVAADMGLAASVLGFELASPSGPTPTPPAPDSGTHPRSQCPTNGWVVQGDGHKTRCTKCDPPYGDETPQDLPQESVEVPSATIEAPSEPDALGGVSEALPPLVLDLPQPPLMLTTYQDGFIDQMQTEGAVCTDGSCGASSAMGSAGFGAGGRALNGERLPRVRQAVQRVLQPVRRLIGRRRGCRGC